MVNEAQEILLWFQYEAKRKCLWKEMNVWNNLKKEYQTRVLRKKSCIANILKKYQLDNARFCAGFI